MNSSNAAGNFDLDHAYLRATVAAPLTAAMAQLAILQPEDPVEFLGNYLLKFVANELEAQRVVELKRGQQRTNASAPGTQQQQLHSGSNAAGKAAQDAQNELEQMLAQERKLQLQLQSERSVPQLFQRFLEWLCPVLSAEEAYIGRRCASPDNVELVHWVASSRANSVTLDKFVSEEHGVTFDVFKEVGDSAAAVDGDGNPLPPAVPKYVHVENVLREPRVKFFHVPKLGAYLTKGLQYHSFLHADVFNDASPETPNIKEDWLVVSLDTMGQARPFTQREVDAFQRCCAMLAQSVEELERALYMTDFERKTTNDDALLHEFHVAYAAQVAVQEENLVLQLQSLPEDEKNAKELELRAAFMTYLLATHAPTLAMASPRVVPFKRPVLLTFAAALGLLGHPRQALFNPVTKSPSWEKMAPLLEESTLKACLEAFPAASPPPVADAKLALGEASKGDVEAASPIAFCFYLWVQAVIAHRESLDALAELAREQEAAAAAAGEGESDE
ncbi:hypothetical protein PybrP1_003260 [[Pythium] brassicae (nom. inval.)]|nr:hypothetical protein PybrP1_003260 [[Pythium] brassicae (nom. inval.)]